MKVSPQGTRPVSKFSQITDSMRPDHLKKTIPISTISDKTDLLMVLEGQCYLTLDVKITYDQSESLKFLQEKFESKLEGTVMENVTFEEKNKDEF